MGGFPLMLFFVHKKKPEGNSLRLCDIQVNNLKDYAPVASLYAAEDAA